MTSVKLLATKSDLVNFKYDILKEINAAKMNTIKWVFILGIGQIGVILTIVLLLLNK